MSVFTFLDVGFLASTRQVENANPLLSNLIAWYSFDESSGNATDSHTGGYNLTQNGTVGTASGKVGTARSFSANNSNFFSQSGSQFNFGDGTFYGATWVYPVDTALRNIASVWNEDDNNRQWNFDQYLGNFRFYITSDGIFGDGNFAIATSSAYTTNAWNFVEFYHDATANEVGIALNGGSFTTVAFSKGLFPGASTPFRVGRIATSTDPNPFSGRIDELALWTRKLTGGERATLYNSGSGIGYPI